MRTKTKDFLSPERRYKFFMAMLFFQQHNNIEGIEKVVSIQQMGLNENL